jgi:clan AA aspartic protease (TIGR02281 family)
MPRRIAQALGRCVLALPLILALQPGSAETIKLERRGGLDVVPALVNGAVSLKFIIDSGASDVVIPSDVMRKLVRSGAVTDRDVIGTTVVRLADGSEHSSRRFVLHELKVGDHALRNVTATVSPEGGEPLLGQSFLARLPSWMIDNNRHALVLDDDRATSGKRAASSDTSANTVTPVRPAVLPPVPSPPRSPPPP